MRGHKRTLTENNLIKIVKDILFILLFSVTLFGCSSDTRDRERKIIYRDFDMICLNGVIYYSVNGYHSYNIVPAYNFDGSLMLCDRNTSGQNQPKSKQGYSDTSD